MDCKRIPESCSDASPPTRRPLTPCASNFGLCESHAAGSAWAGFVAGRRPTGITMRATGNSPGPDDRRAPTASATAVADSVAGRVLPLRPGGAIYQRGPQQGGHPVDQPFGSRRRHYLSRVGA